jgi:hypothetical protein
MSDNKILEKNTDIVYPIWCRPDKDNILYKKMLEILEVDSILEQEYQDYSPVYALVDYLKKNKIFSEETLLDKSFNEELLHVPLKEWNEKTGMNIRIDETKWHHTEILKLTYTLDYYEGTIMITTLDKDNKRTQYVCFYGKL